MANTEINKQKSCTDSIDLESLQVSEALHNIYTAIVPITETNSLPIKETLNRVLAETIRSPLNVPPTTNSAMDGYALNSDDIPAQGHNNLQIIGNAFAGKPYSEKVGEKQCVRIMTGATMPENTDTVIIQEHIKRTADTITIDAETQRGANVRQAGEDIVAGNIVLHKGTLIRPATIGILASLGIGEVSVTRKLRASFFSTGDELCPINTPLKDGHIYDSNRYTLFGMLTELDINIMDLGIVGDNYADLRQAFIDATQQADIIITTGGVSVGDADFVKQVLQEIGSVNFWKVAIKPGRPLAFGQIQDTLFFGLPGNPVSVMVTFEQFIKPAIKYLAGAPKTIPLMIKVACMSKLNKRQGRVEYQRGILKYDENQRLIVSKTGAQGSGILSSMSLANCFIILPTTSTTVQPGDMVDVKPFSNAII